MFLPLLIPLVWLAVELVRKRGLASGRGMHLALRAFGAGTATIFLLYLTLASTVWLPLRLERFAPGQPQQLDGIALGRSFSAYLLSEDKDGVDLLVDMPRAVVHAAPGVLLADPPICIPERTASRFIALRPSQVLGLDIDPGSPYPVCTGGRSPQTVQPVGRRVPLTWALIVGSSWWAWVVARRPSAEEKEPPVDEF
jgi:hypothetical protein